MEQYFLLIHKCMYSEMRKKNAFKKQILKENRKRKNLDTHEVFQRKEKK